MRKIEPGRYQCTVCGEVITTEVEDEAPFDFTVARPDRPNERVVTLHGKEIHRCVVGHESARRPR